ncbi:hypothetical protein ACFOZY_08280 [Chungangia koreensis]|uniref:Uncharacterized protein n=1 Tax=Chungangia koreensis TaxID=752657 RepID=A0ABV8X5N5_9LACT
MYFIAVFFVVIYKLTPLPAKHRTEPAKERLATAKENPKLRGTAKEVPQPAKHQTEPAKD